MTCREWMQQNHPELVGESYEGGVAGCPHEYGLAEKFPNRVCTTMPCEACWDRPVTNAAPVSSQQEGSEMHKWAVVTTSGLPVYEGSHAQCESYIDQAIRKGSEPGYLTILKLEDLEHVADDAPEALLEELPDALSPETVQLCIRLMHAHVHKMRNRECNAMWELDFVWDEYSKKKVIASAKAAHAAEVALADLERYRKEANQDGKEDAHRG